MRGWSEFTGRANPDRTSLRTIMRPAKDGYLPEHAMEVMYDKAVSFDRQQIPQGEVDIRAIVGARRLQEGGDERGPVGDMDVVAAGTGASPNGPHARPGLRALADKIIPGRGWYLLPAGENGVPVGYCDGSTDYHSCKRDKDTDCLVNEHQDARGGHHRRRPERLDRVRHRQRHGGVCRAQNGDVALQELRPTDGGMDGD